MADVAENVPVTDAATAVALGKRHLLVRDYNNAVNTLIQACELLVQQHGEGADELAEPYLLYGRALLGLAREESNILGTGVPGEKDSDDEVEGEDDEEAEDDEKEEKNDEKDEKDEEDEKDKKTEKDVNDEKQTAVPSEEKKSDDSSKSEGDNKTDEKKGEELKEESEKSADESTPKVEENKSEETKSEETNATDDKKAEEKSKEGEKSEVSKAEATPGSSKMANGESCSLQNGEVKENGEDDNEEASAEDEDVDNLEVAWEVLELAKLVLLKRGPPGWKFLAEAHKLLGEVAMEGGNANGAVTDFHACLDLLQKIEPCDPRAIAEIYYQLGLAYSFMNDFDSSIEQFREASALLEARIKELEETTEPPKSEDPFYSVEGEIKELKELLPEIEDKISDTKDAKEVACKLIIESIKEKAAAGSCSNGASTSSLNGASSSGSSSGSSSSKPVSDISHLIRKKRKPEETSGTDEGSPCKKLSPQ